MRKFWKLLYDITSLLKVLSIIFAALYILIWFLEFAQLYFLSFLYPVFEPLQNFVKTFADVRVDFMERSIEMSYIFCAVISAAFYPVFSFAADACQTIIKNLDRAALELTERKVEAINKDLEKEYSNQILSYDKFVILLRLNLKLMVDPNLMSFPVDIEELRNAQYGAIEEGMASREVVESGKYEESLYFIVRGFNHFDTFLPKLLTFVSRANAKNKEKEVETGFNLTVDAMSDRDNVDAALKHSAKILSFNYKNKAIATGGFVTRYDFEGSQAFTSATLGISRFFEKNTDADMGRQKYTDFELFALRKKSSGY